MYESLLQNCKQKAAKSDDIDDYNKERLMLDNNRKERQVLNTEKNRASNVKVVNLAEIEPQRPRHVTPRKVIKKSEPKFEPKGETLAPEKLFESPEKPVATPEITEAPQDSELVSKIQRYTERILRKRVEFGVTEKGTILKDDANEFARSSVKESVQYLLTKNSTSPSGTAVLYKRLLNDSFFANVFEPEGQEGSGRWKPCLW